MPLTKRISLWVLSCLLLVCVRAAFSNGGTPEDQRKIKQHLDGFFKAVFTDPANASRYVQPSLMLIDGFNGTSKVFKRTDKNWITTCKNRVPNADTTEVLFDNFHVEERSAGVLFSIVKRESRQVVAQGTLLVVQPELNQYRIASLCIGPEKIRRATGR